MTWLDWLIVAMTIWFLVQGVLKGATAALLGAVAIAIAFLGSAMLLPGPGTGIAQALMTNIQDLRAGAGPSWARTIGFLTPFAILYIVLLVLINVFPGGKRPSMLAQVIGVFTGLLKALTASMALVGILLASPFSEAIAADIERSSIAREVAEFQRLSIQRLSRISPIPFPPVGLDHKF
jgi:hypothetical protein